MLPEEKNFNEMICGQLYHVEVLLPLEIIHKCDSGATAIEEKQ